MNYDSGYHLLFSNPHLVEDLICHFVPLDWVKQLDFSTLTRVNAKFHTEAFTRREGDMIYRVYLKNGKPLYLYLLLEFQSNSDSWMAVRVGAYVFLLYQQLIKEKRISVKSGLPPVFPIVLYNGDKPWTAALNVKDLITLPDASSLWAYQPDLGYYLIEERLHPVESGDSRVGLLFEIGNCSSREQLGDVIQRLAALTEQPEDTALRRAFLQWIKWVLSQNNRIDFAIENISDLSEIHVMLNTRIDQWGKKMLEQGREEGLEQGLEKGLEQGFEKGREQGKTIGKQLGESTLLYQQLERRFGPLPGWVGEKLSSADSESLENWGIAFLDAKTLEEVFTESSE